MQIAKQHVIRDVRQDHDIKKALEHTAQSMYVSAEKALDIPALTTDLLNMTLRGQTRFNLDLTSSKSLMDQFGRIMNRLVVGIITAALLLASSLICTTNMQPQTLGIPTLGFIGYLAALVLGIILILVSHHSKDK